jgi:transporter family protein
MNSSLLLIVATILWGVWGLADKYAVAHAHPFTIQWMYSLPYIILLPLWYFLSKRSAPSAPFDLHALGWSLLACLCSTAAMLLLFFALRDKPASAAVAMTSAYPLVTLLLAVLTRSEEWTLPKLIGCLLIIAGVVTLQIFE